ncbi:hypothetical protein FQN60_000825 [Etheostoma spectabile]|uniref:Uncharacterized protein n=1 Tax=Etheostoma spectabile TaxID=54343 RepID=A0A5J5D0J5_9PERO|nr:hypothetical protein FQN60_000825 [Etheostoma spectabile]
MDVQTENMDPPPCESQSSGKIRKGFKLFGKRKPGNIFSIRSKGDGNNKSPVISSTTIDGLSETTAGDLEQELNREKGQEVSQGEREQAEEEQLGEDGTQAAAPARASISSASSARSLSFLSLLRGGRRGVGDRRVHTVSQPVGRHRRGLKGLFDNVMFRSRDKEKEAAPPSPLLMSSRTISVEIINEDLTLTPKSQPRSLDSPETGSWDPEKSLTTQESAATSPSETITPQVTAGNVSRTNEHVPPLPISEPPLVPGDNSLSCLLADISSLLTFDSISGGGDIMADVEAEWGKASSPIGAVVTEVTPSSTSLFSKPTISTPLTSASVSTGATSKPSSVAVPTTAPTQSFTPLTKTSSTSSPIAKPSSIITTLTKSSTLTTHSSEAPASAKTKGGGQASVDGQLTSPSSSQGAQAVPFKTEALHNESLKNLQGPTRERKIPQAKASGLSKIPIVGGGKAGKLPVRDSQHVDDEACRDPPTPVQEEERPNFNSHDAGNKDKISDVEAYVPTSKHTQEESQQLPQPKVLTSLPRDSKIPVKHGTQSHTASQTPQAKEPSRTKIPVSKVPVRRAGLDFATHFDQKASTGFISDGQMEAAVRVVSSCLNMAVKIKVVFPHREILSGEQAEKLVSRLSELSTLTVSEAWLLSGSETAEPAGSLSTWPNSVTRFKMVSRRWHSFRQELMLPTLCPGPSPPFPKDNLLSPKPRSEPVPSISIPRELREARLALLGVLGMLAGTVTSGGCSREERLRRCPAEPTPLWEPTECRDGSDSAGGSAAL